MKHYRPCLKFISIKTLQQSHISDSLRCSTMTERKNNTLELYVFAFGVKLTLCKKKQSLKNVIQTGILRNPTTHTSVPRLIYTSIQHIDLPLYLLVCVCVYEPIIEYSKPAME